MIGYDYTARIAPSALKAAGCAVAFRYTMPQTPFWVKALRNAEAEELLAAGIPIVSNFESTANREGGGAQAGHDDAVTLIADWRALSAPAGLIGWFSADWNVQPSEVAAVLAYLNAAATVLGGKQYVGCYGGFRIVKAAADAGFAIWQTVAWSGGQWDPRAVARQTGRQLTVGGVQVDENVIINLAALGAWGGPTASTGGTTMSNNVIPASVAHHFPGLDLSADFPANAPFDEATADIWADARAEAAWRYGLANNNKLDELLARAAPQPVDLAALETAIGSIMAGQLSHLTGGVDTGALAAALAPELVAHLGLEVVAKG